MYQLMVDEDEASLGVREDICDLGGGETSIDRANNRAGSRDSVVSL